MQPITLCIMIASGYERAEIPALQYERLEFLLSSIVTRERFDHRIIVCDDYSSNSWGQERCSEVCSKYHVEYKVKPSPWKGPCGNYNYAVELCETENIAMLGDDQFCTSDWWEYMQYFIDHNPDLPWGMLGWSVVFVEDLIKVGYYSTRDEFYLNKGKAYSLNYSTLPREAILKKWCNWDRPRFRGCCSGTAFIVKKSIWKDLGGFFEMIYQFDEDYGDNIWNITNKWCIQVPTPPILHYGGACAWPPNRPPSDTRWRKAWEIRPWVPIPFEIRGQRAAEIITKIGDQLSECNFKPLIYAPIQKGELIIDLGMGKNRRHPEAIGIDIVGKPTTEADIICNLGFDPIPLQDNSCKFVMAHDLLEHIPHTQWIERRGRMIRLQPTVQLFNEVYRILKPGGIFETNTPVHPHCYQDPTHSSIWTPETFTYFSGSYGNFKEAYGHTSNFRVIGEKWDDIHYHVTFEAIK
jgi:hypothetical protein